MIRLYFSPPAGEADWQAWTEECGTAVRAMAPATSKPAIKAELYKRMRDRLLVASNKKCAYCEVILTPGQRAGDVEHYRPKGRVRDERGNIVTVTSSDGAAQEHPGYYWLAYDWQNLLPCCSACIRRAYDSASGLQTGKGDIFPTVNDWWASNPDEIERELPALLNPWVDDPDAHLIFDPETGIVGGKTARGLITIKVLGLNRDGLPEARRLAAERAIELYAVFLGDKLRGVVDPSRRNRLRSIVVGSEEFDGACVAAVRFAWARIFDGEATAEPPELDQACWEGLA